MKVRDLWKSLSSFFFTPVSPYPAAVFRILLGLCACGTFMLLHADWLQWFGVHGWISMKTIEEAETGFRLNLFAAIPQSDSWIEGLYWLFLVASVTLTLGLGTRLSSILVFLGLNSVNQRMPLILHGGDTFLRTASFFMMFASSGVVLSLDHRIRVFRKSARGNTPKSIAPWPLRLIQWQLAIVYLASFWWKAKGPFWLDGSALYYVLHLQEVRQFPLPHLVYNTWLLRLGDWSVMAFELLFPLLVWFRRFKLPMLFAGLAFHLSLEYVLNVPMFQWDILAAYVLFLSFDSPVKRDRWSGPTPLA